MAAVLTDLRWWSEDVHVEMYQDARLWWFVLGFGEVLQCEKATNLSGIHTMCYLCVILITNVLQVIRQLYGKGNIATQIQNDACQLLKLRSAVLTYMDPEWCLLATDGVEAKGCSVHRTDSDQITCLRCQRVSSDDTLCQNSGRLATWDINQQLRVDKAFTLVWPCQHLCHLMWYPCLFSCGV